MLKKIFSKNSSDDVISTLIDYYNKAKFEEIIRQESELTYLYPDSIFLLISSELFSLAISILIKSFCSLLNSLKLYCDR